MKLDLGTAVEAEPNQTQGQCQDQQFDLTAEPDYGVKLCHEQRL